METATPLRADALMNAYTEDLKARKVDHGLEPSVLTEENIITARICIDYVYDVEVEELQEVEPHVAASAAGSDVCAGLARNAAAADGDETDGEQDDDHCPITLSIIPGGWGCDLCNGGAEEAVWNKGRPDGIAEWIRLGCPTREELDAMRQE
ncbi:hypothetical protein GPECTOR_81g212 [Gonium pectorale]|uniref:Uncharacterized protein n=1 Tax=Gonium pectorale TaxID=33097 RepID=A0A150G1L3_GONPE|nr:hypothetical protein GPECTOR_81g212 [Gonium pectorale]|eukprot:KXZ43762.1 hypothetical protein GPECTOR_81g212 [Gonium pectorale]